MGSGLDARPRPSVPGVASGGSLGRERGASADARLSRRRNPAGLRRRSGAEAGDPRLGGRGAWALVCGGGRGWEPGCWSAPHRVREGASRGRGPRGAAPGASGCSGTGAGALPVGPPTVPLE